MGEKVSGGEELGTFFLFTLWLTTSWLLLRSQLGSSEELGGAKHPNPLS